MFIWMVDIFNLLPHMSGNVSNNLRGPLWYVMYSVASYFPLNMEHHVILVLLFSGKLCFRMAWYFIWPFGKLVEKVT